MREKLNRPVFFKQNRVRRIYTGGKLFSEFFGDDSQDGYFPEEWVCSVTTAMNEGSTDPKEGVSLTEDGVYFDDLLNTYHKEMLGDRSELGILVKILDSSIRLPIQTHPDKEFSEKYFNSTHGKAESWVILATRENACLYFGFKDVIPTEQFAKALQEGEEALIPLLNRVEVKTGDVFFIPARAVHAIGAGCLILETQEPTDFTIQPEKTCGDYVLSENEKYLGLSPEIAMSCFDMTIAGEKAEQISRKIPKAANGVEQLITKADTPCFAVNRIVPGEDKSDSLFGPAVYVVTEGEGTVSGNGNCRSIKKGDYFFMPHCADGQYTVNGSTLKVVQCLPPEE